MSVPKILGRRKCSVEVWWRLWQNGPLTPLGGQMIEDKQLRFLLPADEAEFGPRTMDTMTVPSIEDVARELLRARKALRYYADDNSYALGRCPTPTTARRLLPETSASTPRP